MEERLHTFWSTNILHKEFKQHQKVRDDLLEFVKDYKNKVPNGREGSENSNLYESNYDVTSYIERYPCLKELINFIGDGFKEVAYFSNKHIWEIQKINPSNVSAKITSLWFIDYLQDGSGEHNATVLLYGNYGTDFNFTQHSNTTQNYTLSQNCQTSGGCSVTVNQQ